MKIHKDIWIISDTHFGHDNLVNWGERKKGFNETIVNNWNRVIKRKDTVIHLGDLSFLNKHKTREITSKLNGKKYLIRGNHDTASESWLEFCGFKVIPELLYRFEDEYVCHNKKIKNEIRILFTHHPVINIDQVPLLFNIHGHLHGNDHRGVKTSFAHFDASTNIHDLKAIKLGLILEYFKLVYDDYFNFYYRVLGNDFIENFYFNETYTEYTKSPSTKRYFDECKEKLCNDIKNYKHNLWVKK